MTVKELKAILNHFDDDKDVIVFDDAHSIVVDVDSVSDNNGHVQINIGEE